MFNCIKKIVQSCDMLGCVALALPSTKQIVYSDAASRSVVCKGNTDACIKFLMNDILKCLSFQHLPLHAADVSSPNNMHIFMINCKLILKHRTFG